MLDALILLAFVAYSITSGLLARKQASRGLEAYFLAGRKLRGWQAGTSMAATQFAADTPLLVMGLVATAGVFAVWRLWIYALAFLALGLVFAPMWRRAGVVTDAELTELRYGGGGALALRGFKAVYYGLVFNVAVLAMVLKATVIFTEVLAPWHEWLPGVGLGWLHAAAVALVDGAGWSLASGVTGLPGHVASANNLISVVLIFVFTTLYSLTGGLRGVVRTDVAQFALALVGTAGLAWVVAAEAGGLTAIPGLVAERYGEAEASRMLSFMPRFDGGPGAELLAPFLIVISMQWLFQMNSDGTGYLAQRTMACRDEREASVAGVVMAWLQIVLRSLPWLVIAAGLLLVYPFTPEEASAEGFKAQREATFVLAVDELLGPGLRGLMVTALLAALASTLDTHLNWGAGYMANDLYKRIANEKVLRRAPADRELVWVARASNVAIVLLALAVLPLVDSIQEAWYVTLTLGAGVGAVLVLRWVWERVTVWCEIGSIVVSLAAAPVLLWWTLEVGAGRGDALPGFARAVGGSSELQLLVMAAVTTLIVVLLALFGPRGDPAATGRFFETVRPIGFWGETARSAGRGEDGAGRRRELGRRVLATALAAASVLSALYGLGRLLLPLDGWSAAWGVGAVTLAAGLAPVWWRLGFSVRRG